MPQILRYVCVTRVSKALWHVLLVWPWYDGLRRQMWKDVRHRKVLVSAVTGYNDLTRDECSAPAVAAFMIQTELLAQFQAVDPAATGVTKEWDHRDPDDATPEH